MRRQGVSWLTSSTPIRGYAPAPRCPPQRTTGRPRPRRTGRSRRNSLFAKPGRTRASEIRGFTSELPQLRPVDRPNRLRVAAKVQPASAVQPSAKTSGAIGRVRQYNSPPTPARSLPMRTPPFVLLSFAAIFVHAVSPARGENWPRFRGPTGQGVSVEPQVPVEWSPVKNIAWQTPIPGLGWSSPVVWGDRVFVTSAT